jgi:membrane fusion protein (multidrug efflux system)
MVSRPKHHSKSALKKDASQNERTVLCTTLEPLCAALFVALFLVSVGGCGKKEVHAQAPPPEVRVIEVLSQDVPVFQEWVTQLNGPVNADITPKVLGYLLKQDYTNGSPVRKGQLLFEIDPRPFVAALDQAKADVGRAAAAMTKANNDVQRDTPLAAQQAIPQKQLDDDLANQAAAKAEMEAAKAAQTQAELNLGWTKVYSPVEGLAGVANSQVGDLVGSTTKMVTVSQIDPIWAYFNISESQYLHAAPRISKILASRGAIKADLPVEFVQANDVPYPFKGNIIFLNREVATGTGTIQLAAAFPNKQGILRPGGFGRVRVQTSTNNGALLVPQPAVIEVQSQYQVIVVTPDNKAIVRPVKVGDRVGANWIITEGLKPGDRVVVEGIQKVQLAAAQAQGAVPVTPQPYQASEGGGD